MQSILKETSPGCLLEGLMLRLKLQYFSHLMQRVDSLEKTLMLGGIGGQEEKGTTEDEMAGWHHRLYAHEFGWTLGVGDGQGGLECCNSRGCEGVGHDWATELNWINSKWIKYYLYIKVIGFMKILLRILLFNRLNGMTEYNTLDKTWKGIKVNSVQIELNLIGVGRILSSEVSVPD